MVRGMEPNLNLILINGNQAAAANSSGGVLGKMCSVQHLAIAAAAVGMSGKEGDVFRRLLRWSIGLTLLMGALVWLQSTPILAWTVT